MTKSVSPSADCPLCPRLADFRHEIRKTEPQWFNAPVPTFGASSPRLLIVGLAPGLRGANRTGRPFTGDYAGTLLYETLIELGFARGAYESRRDDGLTLDGCAITNAVRCVPPQNKPLPAEIRTCGAFLQSLVDGLPELDAIVALGHIAHQSLVRVVGVRLNAATFAHGRRHDLRRKDGRPVALFDSYHCSRYNTSTGVLTTSMFRDVFLAARTFLDGAS